MKLTPALLALGLCAGALAAEPKNKTLPPPAQGAAGWSCEELRRFPAPEAQQGVVSDGEFLYVIDDRAIAKYRTTGERVAEWNDAPDGPIVHLNAGIVRDGRLYCAHSNYPGVPMSSSVEIWDTTTLRHIASHSFGRTDGSLTWIARRGERWIACFVHYGKKGGEPGRGPEWTQLVEFDDQWRRTGGWVFPAQLMTRLGGRGYSCSGGAFGPGGFLFATGHDNPELYVLSFPDAGPALRWEATIPIPVHGQAFGWDPHDRERVYFVQRPGEVVVARVHRGGATR